MCDTKYELKLNIVVGIVRVCVRTCTMCVCKPTRSGRCVWHTFHNVVVIGTVRVCVFACVSLCTSAVEMGSEFGMRAGRIVSELMLMACVSWVVFVWGW